MMSDARVSISHARKHTLEQAMPPCPTQESALCHAAKHVFRPPDRGNAINIGARAPRPWPARATHTQTRTHTHEPNRPQRN
eukprot:12106676-Alexandrium_andersonii.AAC.1